MYSAAVADKLEDQEVNILRKQNQEKRENEQK